MQDFESDDLDIGMDGVEDLELPGEGDVSELEDSDMIIENIDDLELDDLDLDDLEDVPALDSLDDLGNDDEMELDDFDLDSDV